MGFVRAVVLGLAVLTVLYLLIAAYFRSVARERLERDWEEQYPGLEGDARDEYIESGMKEYHGSLRRRLILGVYVVPIVAVAVIAYFVNRQ
ncbi:hypothetical protein [Acidimangrovimonas sediminis]|uniref:hypothetical protein n=1 Tax=Acidimangrovimonas sediminis TaxID=2056283 RepID=UPI000C80CF7F|nr:hypothetical protein [Acidimangrovimonas sediminis]